MSRIRLGDIRYLALEGGGGKGTCYLGALHLLSDDSLQGNSPPLLPLNAQSRIRGMSGASAGSIVTYMLAIGMTAKQIEAEMNSKVDYDPTRDDAIRKSGTTPVFNTFFEKPQPGMYKAVGYKRGRNVSGYAADMLTIRKSKALEGVNSVVKELFPMMVSETKSGQFIDSYSAALAAGQRNWIAYSAAYPFLGAALDNISSVIKSSRLKGLDSDGIEGLARQKPLWPQLLHCLLFDRGLLSGNAVREYVRYLTREYLKPSNFTGRALPHTFTDASMQQRNPSELTFRDLYQITGSKLVLMGTNITTKASLPFSVDATPDFPVVDAVCLSMSIPMLFKPTWIAGEVNLSADRAFNYKYKGFFVDGGMLANIPIHAFDYENDNPHRGVQHPYVFGIGLADGVDRNENPGFQKDPSYMRFREAKRAKAVQKGTPADEQQEALKKQRAMDEAINRYLHRSDTERNGLPNMSATDERRSFNLDPGGFDYTIRPLRRLLAPFAIFGDLAGNLMGTLMDFTPEAGQFRTPEERERYVPLDAYDITLTSFTPDPNLATFVNVRSFNKLFWYFFRHRPPEDKIQQYFPGYEPPPVGLPRYDGPKSPTND
ncbi:MAG TPA: patatin-like phospholipase family protein [Thermoanaerobaculia bacterium]|nr:patatin-like phospholipase family protein [Thermoanaerobaculia bacterium]